MKCRKCEHIHHELPDIVVPYKRYEACVIETIITNPSSGLEDYPCEENTAKRLKLWFFLLRDYFESTLYALKVLYHESITINSPLTPFARQPDGWLATLVRCTVNSGRWPQTRSV